MKAGWPENISIVVNYTSLFLLENHFDLSGRLMIDPHLALNLIIFLLLVFDDFGGFLFLQLLLLLLTLIHPRFYFVPICLTSNFAFRLIPFLSP